MSSPPGWTAPSSNEPSKSSFLDFFLVKCRVTTMYGCTNTARAEWMRKGKDGNKVVHKIVKKIFRTLNYYFKQDKKISSH